MGEFNETLFAVAGKVTCKGFWLDALVSAKLFQVPPDWVLNTTGPLNWLAALLRSAFCNALVSAVKVAVPPTLRAATWLTPPPKPPEPVSTDKLLVAFTAPSCKAPAVETAMLLPVAENVPDRLLPALDKTTSAGVPAKLAFMLTSGALKVVPLAWLTLPAVLTTLKLPLLVRLPNTTGAVLALIWVVPPTVKVPAPC